MTAIPLALFAALFLASPVPVLAGELAPGCAAELAAVDASFEETQARLDRVTPTDKVEMCAAIRHHIEVMANGINVFQRCEPPGHDKGENLAQLAASTGDFLDINDAQGCARFDLPKIDWPKD